MDNAHAAKPFGTIDTPGQGGTASGTAFVNFGWALTQNPYFIPADGSTLTVQVDGVAVGRPTYNQFRSDIATVFPGLANSNGAVGFYYIDTTLLANGVHTLAWVVYDNAARGDGIGSRYFTVFNGGVAVQNAGPVPLADGFPTQTRTVLANTRDPLPAGVARDALPTGAARDEPTIGTARDGLPNRDREGAVVHVFELDSIELNLGAVKGYLLLNGERRPLPIGSTLLNGVFYWQTGPGFLGTFTLSFERTDLPDVTVVVIIQPKHFSFKTDTGKNACATCGTGILACVGCS